MDLLLSEEQQQMVDSFTDFLSREFPLERFYIQPAGRDLQDEKRWQTMAELGWFGLGLPTDQGGVGCGPPEEMLLFSELGRHLVTPAMLAAVLAVRVAAHCGDDRLTQAILAGTERPALAIPRGPLHFEQGLSGEFYILDGDHSDLLLTWNDEAALLFQRDQLDSCEIVSSLDTAVTLARASGHNMQADRRLPAGRDSIQARATLLVSAMLVGVAKAVCTMAVDYAGLRQQFGRPIGAFQAIKHSCADMATRTEVARAQLRYASVVLRDNVAEGHLHACAARLLAGSAALDNAAANIQVHGAMGYTAECHAHRFLKRAHLLCAIGGSTHSLQRQLLAASTLTAELAL